MLPSRKTVYFENVYGENQDNRTQRVLAKADPFTVEELKNEEARIFHLGSLLSDDFSLDVVKLLSGKGILAVDAQGYLREVRGEKVFPVDWKDKREALKYIDILKVNEHEAEVLTGYKDAKQAALQLAEWGVKEVLLTLGSLGSLREVRDVKHHLSLMHGCLSGASAYIRYIPRPRPLSIHRLSYPRKQVRLHR
mgnify:CR=1 FL=1